MNNPYCTEIAFNRLSSFKTQTVDVHYGIPRGCLMTD